MRNPFCARWRIPWTALVLAVVGLGVGCKPGASEAPRSSPAASPVEVSASSPAPEGSPERAEPAKPPESGQPELWIDEPVFDWGTAYRGQQIEHTFTVGNRGAALLVIEELKSHCGCTVTRGDEIQKRLAPGESTRVSILIDTALLRGDVKKDTDVISNAPGDNKLWMQGAVEDLWKVEPTLPKVEVVRGSSLSQAPTRIVLSPNLEKPFVIRAISAQHGVLAPTMEELERGQRYEVALTTKADEPEADAFRTEVLQVETLVDGTELSLHLQIPVVLKDRIEVTPSKSVYVHRKETSDMLEGGKTVEKTLHVQSIGGPEHTFRIREAVARDGAFAATVETVTPGKHYRVLVTLSKRPEADQRFLKDSIELRTDDPLVPTLVVPAMAQF